MIFDVKFDLRRKARLVAGGHLTSPPKEDIYSGVVGMEAVRLGFLLASLNNLDVCAADIGNAFLYGKTQEKVYIVAGPEFGPLQGKPLLIDKGLYGLRTSSARFHEHLAEKLRRMGYTPSYADPDLWIKDCDTHYEYLATYVDDILSFSKDPMAVIADIRQNYILKGVGFPEYYLGGDVEHLDEGWHRDGPRIGLSATTYIKNIIEKLEQMMNREFKSYKTPMDENYHPELDTSAFLAPKVASQYRGIIGSCNWLITLGRIDICYATHALARFAMAPRTEHFDAALRVVGYLKRYPKGRIIIDPQTPQVDGYDFPPIATWSDLYPDATEELPTNMPPPKGASAHVLCYVDADHAHDKVTRRSVSGILLLVNNTPIKWVSKRQKTVESSTYGSELVAARIATDHIVEYRYKLRMLGVPTTGPSTLLGDNKSVILSATLPSSTLKQKHNSIAYHRIREAIAASILRFAHIPSDQNLADLLTKPLPSARFFACVKRLLFRNPTHVSGTVQTPSP